MTYFVKEGDLKRRVMRRVYLLYYLRRIFSPTMVRLYIFAALFIRMLNYVSIGDVLRNAQMNAGSAGSFLHFSQSALANTEAFTLILSAGLLLILGYFFRDAILYTPYRARLMR